MLPVGAAISQETEWHNRYRVTFPSAKFLPFQFGACFPGDDDVLKTEVLWQCIEWAWFKNVEKGGEPNPFSRPDVL